eukprot:COSAG01_NODE_4710_length_4797_cov_62.853160_1_plen_80_part_10
MPPQVAVGRFAHALSHRAAVATWRACVFDGGERTGPAPPIGWRLDPANQTRAHSLADAVTEFQWQLAGRTIQGGATMNDG